MGSPERLGHDLVDHSERKQVLGRQAQRIGGPGDRLGGLLPIEDRRAPFGRDHRIAGVLEHQDPIADAERQRAAASSLADHAHHHRNPQRSHCAEIPSDRLRLTALLRVQARECALGVDHGDDRPTKALREPKEAQRLAVSLGPRHAEVPPQLFLRRAPALMADEHHRTVPNRANPPTIGGIVGEPTVAVQLGELVEDLAGVVQGLRPVGMARELHSVPRAQARRRAAPRGLRPRASESGDRPRPETCARALLRSARSSSSSGRSKSR